MKILINNIGNRHLSYKKENETSDYLYNVKKEFRIRTQEILDNWEQEKDNIRLNILKQYLNDKTKPDIVVLFATDQENEYNKQDTVFAAEIIKKILEEKYNIQNVYIYNLKNNPSDENELMPVYKKKFVNLHKTYPDSEWLFLDAGGTPQQKLVCKLLIPEIHTNKYKFEYLKNVEGVIQQDIITKNTFELEKFFILKNIKSLINNGYYESAFQLLNKTEPKNKVSLFVNLGKLRILNIYNKNFSLSKFSKIVGGDILTQYIEKRTLINLNELEINLSDEFDYFYYGEFIARADYFLELKNYNNFILNFQQSLEFLLLSLLLSYAQQNGIILKGNSKIDKVVEFLKVHHQQDYTNLPSQLKIAIEISNEKKQSDITKLLNLYAEINSGYQQHVNNRNLQNGLDVIRNKLVHKGKGVNNKKDIEKIIQSFIEIKKHLNFTTNNYNELKNIIYKYIFQ